jgi:ankyrin repeat protein
VGPEFRLEDGSTLGSRLSTASLLCFVLLGAGSLDRLAAAEEGGRRAAPRTPAQLDLGAEGVDGTTPLHLAAYEEDLEAVVRLIRSGADVKAANRYGVTPLSLACASGNAAVVESLLKAGADPNTVLPGGETVLMTAARAGSGEAVKALLARGADVNAREKWYAQTALMWAAAEGHVAAVEALLHAGADIHARSRNGFTPLLFAVREGRTGAVKALLEAGADVNEKQQSPSQRPGGVTGPPASGTSALALAVVNGHFELAAALLDAGADPNAAVPGWTALHAIASVRKPGLGDNAPAPQGSGTMSSIELVEKLVKHGADVNARMTKKVNFGLTSLNTLGATPFLLAARTADAELMRTLAALGADPLLPNADNSTPLIVAAGLGTRSPGEDAGDEAAVVEALQVALDLGNDIDAVDDNGETAMHGAAYKNLPAAVQFLADKGARIEVWNKKNAFGWTPLAIATGYRFGNFKPSPPTVAAFQRLLTAAGLSTAVDPAAKNKSPYW